MSRPEHPLLTRRAARFVAAAALVVPVAVPLAGSPALAAGPAAPPAVAATVNQRAFSCTGGLGEPFTQRTVTGLLTSTDVPTHVVVTRTADGSAESSRTRAALVGPSALHAGFIEWDVTGHTANGDVVHLNLPGVLPGNGGFFDADLDLQFAGGADGSWQIPMVDCTVTGGPTWLSTPPGPRTFTCSGTAGEAFTARTVTGGLTRSNVPVRVTDTRTATGDVESTRARQATLVGPSWLHAGYTEWDVTAHATNGDVVHLSVPPVLPPVGGFFDADLDVELAGGANGSLQLAMFDCTVA